MLGLALGIVDFLSSGTFLGINYLEWIGYLASFLVLISLTMSSIIKLRWINLAGASIFTLYGFMITAYPVALMNLCISGADIYYLYNIYQKRETFDLWRVGQDKRYLQYFLDYYEDEINKIFPSFEYQEKENMVELFLLRNMEPAGLVIAEKKDDSTIFIHLDFVTPAHRDFKLGSFFYEDKNDVFAGKGFEKFVTYSESKEHSKYLEKMGFSKDREENGKVYYTKPVMD